jgi:hypothetical protein
MKDLLLDATGDLIIENFDLKLTDETTEVKQRIRRKLLCFRGEWYLDEEIGTPYFPVIGTKDTESIFQMLRQSVLEVKGVQDIMAFDVEIDATTRSAKVSLEVSTDNGTTVTDNVDLNI